MGGFQPSLPPSAMALLSALSVLYLIPFLLETYLRLLEGTTTCFLCNFHLRAFHLALSPFV